MRTQEGAAQNNLYFRRLLGNSACFQSCWKVLWCVAERSCHSADTMLPDKSGSADLRPRNSTLFTPSGMASQLP